jgi:Mce-associated membrane protein
VTRLATPLWVLAWCVALLLCALGGWSYADAHGDDDLRHAKARDTALAAGRADIARLNTVDARHPDRDLARWLDATTGPLRDQLSRTHAADLATLRHSGTTTRGTVTDAAVTELDTRAGTARLIATVQVLVTPRSGTTTTDRKRFDAVLARTQDGWKLTALTAVPTGAS